MWRPASPICETALAIATTQHDHMLALFEMAKLAQTSWTHGQLTRAVQVCQTALHYIDQHDLARTTMIDQVHITWGAILCERNDLDHAAEYVLRGLEMCRSGQDVLDQLLAYRTMARLRIAQRDLPAAAEYLRQAEALCQELSHSSATSQHVDRGEISIPHSARPIGRSEHRVAPAGC